MAAKQLAILQRKFPHLALRAGDQLEIKRLEQQFGTGAYPFDIKKDLIGTELYFVIKNNAGVNRTETPCFIEIKV